MSEVKYEVKTYVTEYVCDECGVGTMQPTGIALSSFPEQFQHKCTHCGNIATFYDLYPITKYERVRTVERLHV